MIHGLLHCSPCECVNLSGHTHMTSGVCTCGPVVMMADPLNTVGHKVGPGHHFLSRSFGRSWAVFVASQHSLSCWGTQGSAFKPILFSLYMFSLPHSLQTTCFSPCYADDAPLYLSVRCWVQCHSGLQMLWSVWPIFKGVMGRLFEYQDEGFTAELCTMARWSVVFTSTVIGVNVKADCVHCIMWCWQLFIGCLLWKGHNYWPSSFRVFWTALCVTWVIIFYQLLFL